VTYDHHDDWAGDEHCNNPAVHYRLYLSPRTGAPTVICMQDFDYHDYDARLMISSEAWDSESAAEEALLDLAPTIPVASRAVPFDLERDLRGRLLARAIRNAPRLPR
jgi:hypothetical protein